MVDYSLELYHDVRRAKKDGLYPLKLRLYFKEPKKTQKYYPVKIVDPQTKKVKKCEYQASLKTEEISRNGKTIERQVKDSSELDELRLAERGHKAKEYQRILAAKTKAEETLDEIIGKYGYLNLEEFEAAYFNKTVLKKEKDLEYFFKIKIKESKTASTRQGYEAAYNSILAFNPNTQIHYHTITVNWLKDFEKYLLNDGKSYATVACYCRYLSAVLNLAVDDGAIDRKLLPFGKNKYTIPNAKVKFTDKVIETEDLEKIFKHETSNAIHQKAKDFWFFSFFCNGANLTDVAQLKYRDINKGFISFVRTKTKEKNNNPINVYINDYMQSIIKKYGKDNLTGSEYIFPIINDSMNQEEKDTKIKSLNDLVNRNMKRFIKPLELDTDISASHARHSFKNRAEEVGATFTEISQMMGHKISESVTSKYGRGNKNKRFKTLSERMLDFKFYIDA